MASRNELVRLIHDTVCLCASKPHRFVMGSRDMDAIANRLLAAYPQLAATESEEQWAILCTVDDVEGIDKCEDEEHARYKLARFYPRHHNAVSVRVSSRTVYATPWEDAS